MLKESLSAQLGEKTSVLQDQEKNSYSQKHLQRGIKEKKIVMLMNLVLLNHFQF